MDGRQALGIALGDTQLTAVLLRISRRPGVAATAHVPVSGAPGELAASLNRLWTDFSWQDRDPCVLGLPLSMLSVRNLCLPFQDAGQRLRAFPYEMEEQLFVPAEQVVSVFSTVREHATGADLLAFAAERELLGRLLPTGKEWSFDPVGVCPAVHALALQAAGGERTAGTSLLVHADHHLTTLVLMQAGVPLALRRLSLSPQEENAPGEPSAEELRLYGQTLGRAISRSLVLFGQHHKKALDKGMGHLLLCGPLAGSAPLKDSLAERLGLPVRRPQLPLEEAELRRLAPDFDAALACALQALHWGRAGSAALNLRTGDFARPGGRLWQRRRIRLAAGLVLAACAGCLLFGLGALHSLKNRSQQLQDEMTRLYRNAFPEVQVVRDPYMEMRATLGERTGGPPLFASGRESALSVLADISARIPARTALRIERLTLDQELVLLRGQTGSFGDVDQIRNLLAASPLFEEVRILSSTAEKSGAEGAVRFELRLQRVPWRSVP